MGKICMMVTNPCTNDARVLREASTLSKSGYNVIILAIMGNNTPKVEHVTGFTIKRIKRRFRGNTLLGKLEFTLKFTFIAIREKADVYHAHDLSTLLECYIASRVNRAKIVYDSHELYISCYGEKSFGDFLYYILEKLLIKKVDNVVTVNEYIAKELQTKYTLIDSPTVVMNCPQLNLEDDQYKTTKDICDIPTNGRKVLLYQGTVQEGRGLRQLIESMKYLSDDYYLLMIGNGPLKEELEGASRKMDLSHKIYFTGMVSLVELVKYTKIANLGVILFENISLNNYYASPNKLFEYIHANVPVLAPNYPFFKDVIEKYDIGILIDKIEPKEIANKIEFVFEDMNKYREMKNNTKTAARELNWENEERKLIETYEMLNKKIRSS